MGESIHHNQNKAKENMKDYIIMINNNNYQDTNTTTKRKQRRITEHIISSNNKDLKGTVLLIVKKTSRFACDLWWLLVIVMEQCQMLKKCQREVMGDILSVERWTEWRNNSSSWDNVIQILDIGECGKKQIQAWRSHQ